MLSWIQNDVYSNIMIQYQPPNGHSTDTATNPFNQTLLSPWSVDINSFTTSHKLHQHYSKGIYISFLCNLPTLGIFWS